MNIPKVVFKPISLKDNIELIYGFYYDNNTDCTIHNYTIEYFKELKNINHDASKKDVYEFIKKLLTEEYNKYEKHILKECERYNKIWDKYNDKYFKLLTEYLDVDFPSNIKVINATVGLLPVFPRYLDDYTFSLGTGLDDSKVCEVTAHETLHFLWFEKWRKLHPETPRDNYENPHMEWRYSEMVTDPILNNKPFNKLFDFTEMGYNSFYELRDGDELVMDKLRNIYATDKSIDSKIDEGYNYITKIFNENKKR